VFNFIEEYPELDYTPNSKHDMWAVGCLMYLLFTGEAPFDGKNDTEVIKNV